MSLYSDSKLESLKYMESLILSLYWFAFAKPETASVEACNISIGPPDVFQVEDSYLLE